MDRIKIVPGLIWLKFISMIVSPRILIGYFYGLWLGFLVGQQFVSYSSVFQIGIFDSFILLMNRPLNLSLIIIGFFVLIADAPFVNGRTYYVMIRSGTLAWHISMLGYLFLQLMIYMGMIMLGCIIPEVIRGNVTMEWSESMQILLKATPKNAILVYNFPIIDGKLLETWSSGETAAHCFLLCFLYTFFLGLIVYIGNLNFSLPIGHLCAVAIHFIGVLTLSDFVPVYWLSLVAHGILQYHIPKSGELSLVHSYALFLMSNAITLLLLRKNIPYIDYNVAASDRFW